MFENFDPTRRVMKEEQLDRRSALFGLGALMGGSALLGAGALAPTSARAAKSLNLDLRKAEDNLTAWVKLVSSLEDGVETCGYFAGTQYAVIGTQDIVFGEVDR